MNNHAIRQVIHRLRLMVVTLKGRIDGKDILFQCAGEKWEAYIPKELKGFYVVELEAFDEAGNRSYATNFLLTFDPAALSVKLEPQKYQANLIPPDFSVKVYLSPYCAILCGD